jgi:pyroglutamyl-peptidase
MGLSRRLERPAHSTLPGAPIPPTDGGMPTRARRPILLTGFEPFGGDTINSSQEVVQALDGAVVGDRRVAGRVLPCVFGEAPRMLLRWIEGLRPPVVVCLGQAGGRAEVTPERVAINLDDARIPDNAGAQPVDTAIVPGGPVAHWSRLLVKAIVAALAARGLPARVSNTAGTFVCNHVFYALLHAVRRRRSIRAGFIHLPPLPAQVGPGEPCLALEQSIEAVRVALEVAVLRLNAHGARASNSRSTSRRGTPCPG